MAGADRVARASLINTTVALGITPPCWSRTVPEIVPVVICANAADVASMHATRTIAAEIQVLRSIDSSPLKNPAEVPVPVIDYTKFLMADYATRFGRCL